MLKMCCSKERKINIKNNFIVKLVVLSQRVSHTPKLISKAFKDGIVRTEDDSEFPTNVIRLRECKL
jgi:hypothetical protein